METQKIDIDLLPSQLAQMSQLAGAGIAVTITREDRAVLELVPARKRTSIRDLKTYDLGKQLAPIKATTYSVRCSKSDRDRHHFSC